MVVERGSALAAGAEATHGHLIDELLEQASQPVHRLLDRAHMGAGGAPLVSQTGRVFAELGTRAGRLLSFVEDAGRLPAGITPEADSWADCIIELGKGVQAVYEWGPSVFAEMAPGPSLGAMCDAFRQLGSAFPPLLLISPLQGIVGNLSALRMHVQTKTPPFAGSERILAVGDRLLEALHAHLARARLDGFDQWEYKRISYELRELLAPLVGLCELVLDEADDVDRPPEAIGRILAASAPLLTTLDALTTVSMIEARVAYIKQQIRQFVEDVAGADASEFGIGGEQEPQLAALGPGDLERFAPQWASFMPEDIQARAATALLLCAKHRLRLAKMPGVRTACGLDEPPVSMAFQRLLGSRSADELGDPQLGDWEAGTFQSQAGWLNLARDEVLFRQGDAADHLYFLVSGRLRTVVRDQDGIERVVTEVSHGETVDEMAVLMDEHRSASVFALRDSELLTLSKATFDGLCERSPRLMRHFTTQVVRRLRAAVHDSTGTRSSANAIAVVPADPSVPLEEFCRGFAEALSLRGSVMSMTKAQFEQALPETRADADSALAASWLNSQEQRHRFVLYAADGPSTAWSRRCLRQADRILLLARASSHEPLSRTAQMVIEGGVASGVRCDLVLLGSGPASNVRWRGNPRFLRRYHVGLTNPADIARLARCQVGDGIGLVLGGGAARGFAHIGVLRALKEADIPVDLVGGTSMGALVAAAHCLGLGWESMLRDLLPPRAVMADFSFPAVALTRGVRFREWLGSWVGDVDIEDLRLPFYCVSSNLTTAEARVHTSGALLKALMASNALPIMMPPVIDHGDLLVDGGLLSNVPTDAMHAFPDAGSVVAVDTVPPVDLGANDDYGLGVSGWRILSDKLTFWRRPPRLPSIFSIELRAQQVPSLAARKVLPRGPNDLYIEPPLEKFSSLDYRRIREIAEIGYRWAAPVLAEWKAKAPDWQWR